MPNLRVFVPETDGPEVPVVPELPVVDDYECPDCAAGDTSCYCWEYDV